MAPWRRGEGREGTRADASGVSSQRVARTIPGPTPIYGDEPSAGTRQGSKGFWRMTPGYAWIGRRGRRQGVDAGQGRYRGAGVAGGIPAAFEVDGRGPY